MAFKCVGPKSTTLTTAVPKVRDNPTSAADILQDIDVANRYQDEDWYFILKIPGSKKFFYASSSVELTVSGLPNKVHSII
jgi:hypothetical protein